MKGLELQDSNNLKDMIDHRSCTVMKLWPEKDSGLNGIRTHDLRDAGAVLYQLSYQANWELVIL